MNYLAEINAFNRWCELNYLPPTSQLIWYKLIDLCNSLGWKEWVQIDNQRLMAKVQVKSEDTFTRNRDKLIEAGLIEYLKGKKSNPNKYKLISFTLKNGVYNGVNIGVENQVYNGVNNEVETRVKTPDINKLKTKTKNIYSASDDTQNNSSTQKNSSTKQYKVFEKIWSMYPEKKGKGQVSKKSKEQIEKIGIEKMEKALQRYIDDVAKQRKQGFTSLRYKNGSTWFNSGYEDYLVEESNIAEIKKEPAKIVYVNRGYL